MQKTLDLDLWLDQSLIQRQNQLKADFLYLFEQVGNHFSNQELADFFPNSKGKKISKGNQLEGFPYIVLDLIRDFDLITGCNIRLVSWFGHGLYCCVFLGQKKAYPSVPFLETGFQLGDVSKPWDLPAQLDWLESSFSIATPQKECVLWIKKISLPSFLELAEQRLKEEVIKILQVQRI